MILTNEHIKQVVTTFFKDKPVNKVWLFGSYARGDADETSDVDVMVEMDINNRVGMEYYSWSDYLAESMKKKVDIISHKWINKRIKPYIENDKFLIYEKQV